MDRDVAYDIRSLELVREYIEKLVAKSKSTGTPRSVDWNTIYESIAQAESLEQAIGRAVLLADQMAKEPRRLGADARARPGWPDQRLTDLPGATAPASVTLESHRPVLRTRVMQVASSWKIMASTTLSVVLMAIWITYAVSGGNGTVAADYTSPHVKVVSGNAQLVNVASQAEEAALRSTTTTTVLPAATSTPLAAPPSLAGAAPLRSHEVFGFAPYWTLGQSAGFNLSDISTLAYFSVGVNADGSLDESGAGWNGFQSQDLANLITRAHAAGDRVVLTVNCFDQGALDQLTSSPTAPATLAAALLGAMKAKNFDGVNLDFEGTGSQDQTGLTNLVHSVSGAIKSADPHYQVTMDTYASSAGDPNGFYNIPALSPYVDAFFVMEYQLNLQAAGSAESPLTSTMFSDHTTIAQYAGAVPASKVILGLPYFGIDWPTTNGTLTAQAMGPATPVAYAQIVSGGHPIYWDATTDTAWTSYQVGSQWHETFFEDPTSLYDIAQAATGAGLTGVGIWALGMDGNSQSMLSALLGFSPALKDTSPGPSATSTSPPSAPTSTSPSSSSTSTTTSLDSGTPTTVYSPPPPPASTTSTTSTGSSTTPSTDATSTASTDPSSNGTPGTDPTSSTSTTPPSSSTTTSGAGPYFSYSGMWNAQTVTLTKLDNGMPSGSTAPAGQLADFTSNDPSTSCLSNGALITVETVSGHLNEYFVIAQRPSSCMNAVFEFTTS